MLPTEHPCHNCGLCCGYISMEIDRPASVRSYDDIHWYLTHANVVVRVEDGDEWYLEFKTTCRHLTPEKTCGYYEERPEICSEFEASHCEKTLNKGSEKFRFEDEVSFLKWFETQRPKAFKKFQESREKMKSARRAKS